MCHRALGVARGVITALFPAPKLQVKWITHGKICPEFSGAWQNILGIMCSEDSLAPEKVAKLYQKNGKTFSESTCCDWKHKMAERTRYASIL
jgi:hypothetical protein